MFNLVIDTKAEKFLKKLPQKSRRIIVEKILDLKEDPFPGGNKEKLEYPHPPAVYRLHIGRSFTVFYIIELDENIVKIEKILTIERAHKKYSCR
ncbi:MAG: type II toxin-antitoxin system RelE/ParE family toxin [Methanoregula sp.]|nr:type II toxin-antitoxin system RelE/ParE family toxin [Methanoregula sp.]MDD5187727.1 type II toxin-antitoxin system RelE/ParE family toxin [Methanoregula sp.]